MNTTVSYDLMSKMLYCRIDQLVEQDTVTGEEGGTYDEYIYDAVETLVADYPNPVDNATIGEVRDAAIKRYFE